MGDGALATSVTPPATGKVTRSWASSSTGRSLTKSSP